MKKRNKKIIVVLLALLLLTGCSKQLKDKDNNIVKNEETGQAITENVLCRPTDKDTIKIYEKNGVDIDKLPKCENFTPLSNYEGLWTSIFVKPLAWIIIQIGKLVNNYGLAIILACALIRGILLPITKKTAMQSEMMKKAQPELQKLEKKYANKTTQEDQQKKAQEMLLIYQKYKINPMSGCLLAFLQLPLLLAFYEAINRTPAIFEDTFLSLKLGMTPSVAIAQGEYQYIILIVLILVTTYFSFSKTMKDQSTAGAGAPNMKFTLYFMLFFIGIASFSLASALGVYWIVSSLFTIVQNIYVERKKK